ncbi:MAG: acetate--CoA ligase family protein [Gammaproteobacteria bacterium]
MNPAQKKNLQRLLAPRHIAFIGGDSAVFAAEQCAAGHFQGAIWGVNPKKDRFKSLPCFSSVAELPEAPDAVFLAVPRQAVPEVLDALRERGAGGIVCYSAGFGELGSEGLALEDALIRACGDMALAGPNVFGLLNYVTGAHLWPFSHGGKPVQQGPAIISQSGMLSSYLLTNRRSVFFSYVIGAGNQSVLGVEDYLEHLADDPTVNGFGLYIETLRDIPRFADAVGRALARGVPVVALKVGRSDLATKTALTHTGSLAGEDRCYQALFERIGVARAATPSLLLETLNFLTISGGPKGNRLAAFTCSGGDVAMLADCADAEGLSFPEPSAHARSELKELLPEIATVGNPLDYTTPLWGQEEALEKVFDAALAPGYDAALIVQDYPPLEIGTDRHYYQADARAFIRATQKAGIPAGVCSSLPENLDDATQSTLIASGVTPLQGIGEASAAIAAASVFGRARARYQETQRCFTPTVQTSPPRQPTVLNEWQGKSLLRDFGIAVPEGQLCASSEAPSVAQQIGFPITLKLVNAGLPHKTEHGVVRLNLQTPEAVSQAAQGVLQNGENALGSPVPDELLVEEMVTEVVAELLVGIKNDPAFGLMMTIASGGTLVELLADSSTVLLPAERADFYAAVSKLKIMKLLQGFRGQANVDIDTLLDTLIRTAQMAHALSDRLVEMDINPLMVTPTRCIAADALIHLGE